MSLTIGLQQKVKTVTGIFQNFPHTKIQSVSNLHIGRRKAALVFIGVKNV